MTEENAGKDGIKDGAKDAAKDATRITKRILIFSLAYYPRFVGGAEVAIKEITDRIADDTIIFDMITLRWDKNLPAFERIGNVNVHRIGWAKPNPSDQDLLKFPLYLTKIFYAPMAFWKARKLDHALRAVRGAKTNRANKAVGYDALWSVMSYMGFPAIFFKIFCRNIPLVLTLQEGDSLEHVAHRFRIRFVMPLYRAVFHRADIVQAISHYLADFARKMEAGKTAARANTGVATSIAKDTTGKGAIIATGKNINFTRRIKVIPNGVDLELFRRRPTDTELFELKQRLGKKYTDTFLITASRLVPKNGVADIIKALKFLPPQVRLVIAGTGPLEQELRELALDEGLIRRANEIRLDSATGENVPDRVIFVGFIPHEQLLIYLRASDIFVRPSLSEGFGNSFIEAMAAEIPVIATPVGGIVDFLTDRHTGMFCQPDDPQSIAHTVEKILANRKFRDSLVVNAREMVIEQYGWDMIARQMQERVFEKVL